MANILDTVKMSDSASSTNNPNAKHSLPPIEDVRKAVIDFLKKMPDVNQVNVTKLALMDSEKGAWEAEAEVYVPNATIKALRLPTQKEVLDSQLYLLRLNSELDIIAYALRDSVVE